MTVETRPDERLPSLRAVSRRVFGAVVATLTPLASCSPRAGAATAEPERFVVFYGCDAAPEAFASVRRAVLDADHHPALAPLQARGTELFGYVSLGEANETRPTYGDAVAAGVLLGPNPNWPGARYVDLRKPAWTALLLERVLPAIVAQGFDGLFLDTLDDAAYLEQRDPVRNGGMVAAAAELVRTIHLRFPTTKLMLNRAFDVAERVAPDLDSILAESLASDYDFKARRYHIRNDSDLNWGMARLSQLRRLNPDLRVYTLDYWDPADHAGVARLYERERRAGFVPYVATIDLQTIVAEPPSHLARMRR